MNSRRNCRACTNMDIDRSLEKSRGEARIPKTAMRNLQNSVKASLRQAWRERALSAYAKESEISNKSVIYILGP